MKKLVLKITSPKTGTSNDAMKDIVSGATSAAVEYLGVHVKLFPPAIIQKIRRANRLVADEVNRLTVPWVNGERIILDDAKIPDAEKILRDAVLSAQDILKEIRSTWGEWIKEVERGVGQFKDTVLLPEPGDCVFELDTLTFTDASPSTLPPPKAADADKALEARNDALQVELAKAEAYRNGVAHIRKAIRSLGENPRGMAKDVINLKTTVADMAQLGLTLEAANDLNAVIDTIYKLASGGGGTHTDAQRDALVAQASATLSKGTADIDAHVRRQLDMVQSVIDSDTAIVVTTPVANAAANPPPARKTPAEVI